MSYGFLLFRAKRLITSPLELSEEICGSMGTVEELRERLTRLFPDIHWQTEPSGRHRGTIQTDAAIWEFSLGGRANADNHYVGLHTAFGTADKTEFLQKLCDATGWVAYDGQPDGQHVLIEPRLHGFTSPTT